MHTSNTIDFSASAVEVAKRLLGSTLVREVEGTLMAGRIVETESYDETDAASHSYRGVTPRTQIMFGPAGFAYVYFTYGMHYCFNVVTGKTGQGSAVLIRALEPLEGLDTMTVNRKTGPNQLTNGPAKLCQALQIDRSLNGHNLTTSPLYITSQPPVAPSKITQTTRVGISKDTHRLWRFYVTGNLFVSRP